MSGTNDILDELRSISAPVAAVSREMPYEVPEGYFTSLPDRVLQQVAGWKDAKSLIYSVPEGYFDQFAQGLLARIKAGAASPETGIASGVDGSSGVDGPSGVDGSSGVEAGAAADPVSTVLERVGRVTPYQVPEGYFEELSPLLTVCRGSNPYPVPEGYFESLSEVVMARTEQASMRKAVVRRMGWMKYSAAAVVAGLIVTVGWLRWHGAASEKSNVATVSVADLSRVSDQELQNFLVDQDTTLAQPLTNTTAANVGAIDIPDMNDIDFKALLGNVPDGELKQYMEEHGGANDVGTN